MLKIFSLIEFGERAGSGLSGICKVWEKVYHTPATIVETHNNGVDRTTLTLPTGGNEQDIKAMLELYSDIYEPQDIAYPDSQNDPQTTENMLGEPLNEYHYSHFGVHEMHEPQNEPLNGPQREPQRRPQKLLEKVRMNPKITKATLSQELGVSSSTLKRWLKANNIIWIGHSKNGHWEILQSN